MLDATTRGQTITSDNVLDTIVLGCIRANEVLIDDAQLSLVTAPHIYYGDLKTGGAVGLIVELHNQSDFDITRVVFSIIEKATKKAQQYKFETFPVYFTGQGIVTGPAFPQYRHFIKSLTTGQYTFPLEFPGVTQQDFFKKYEVSSFIGWGIK